MRQSQARLHTGEDGPAVRKKTQNTRSFGEAMLAMLLIPLKNFYHPVRAVLGFKLSPA